MNKQSAQHTPKFLVIAIIGTVLWILGVFILNNSDLVTFIRIGLAQKIEFVIRDTIGKTPKVSEKLKLSAIDNRTFNYLNGPDMSLKMWAQLLENIAAKHPKAILIDKMFSKSPKDTPENREALLRIKKIKVPIYIGVHPQIQSSQEYHGLHRVALTNDQYNISNYLPQGYINEDLAGVLPPLEDRSDYNIYGPSKELANAFRGNIGHIIYHKKHKKDRDSKVPLIIKVNGDHYLPHLALGGATSIVFRDKKILIDGHTVETNSYGLVDFNHRPMTSYQVRSLYFLIKRAQKGIPETSIDKDDVVLIFGKFTTGNTDFHEGGPFGEVPGGYLVASLVDSVLSGVWLKRPKIENNMIGIMCLAGIVIGYFAGPIMFWLVATAIVITYFLVAMYLFSYQNIIVSWILPITGFTISAAMWYGYQNIQNELKKIAITKDFFAEKALRLEEENKKLLLEESMALGKAVQNMLLPKHKSGKFEQFSFDIKYSPSQAMGGDWVFIWEVSPREQRILIGDVMGKGPSAAIPMAVIIGTIQDCQQNNFSLAETITSINNRLVDLFDRKVTTTCAGVVLYKDGTIDLYNDGSPGWVLSTPGESKLFHLRSNPLGLNKGHEPTKYTIKTNKDSVIFTFTDGYLEGSRAFHRLIRRLSSSTEWSDNIAFLHQILMEIGEGHRLVDDRSMLAIKVSGKRERLIS